MCDASTSEESFVAALLLFPGRVHRRASKRYMKQRFCLAKRQRRYPLKAQRRGRHCSRNNASNYPVWPFVNLELTCCLFVPRRWTGQCQLTRDADWYFRDTLREGPRHLVIAPPPQSLSNVNIKFYQQSFELVYFEQALIIAWQTQKSIFHGDRACFLVFNFKKRGKKIFLQARGAGAFGAH